MLSTRMEKTLTIQIPPRTRRCWVICEYLLSSLLLTLRELLSPRRTMDISRPGSRVASPFAVHNAASERLLAEHPRPARHINDGKAQFDHFHFQCYFPGMMIMGVSHDGCEAGRRSPRKATGRWWLILIDFFIFLDRRIPPPLSFLILSCLVQSLSVCVCVSMM